MGIMPPLKMATVNWRAASLLMLAQQCATGPAAAYTATLTAASPQQIYLQVGAGSFSNPGNPSSPYYIDGGQPGINTTINTVSVSVAAAALGNKTAQVMTTNSTAAQSFWDGYIFCSVPAQLYIGGFYRTASGSTSAAQVMAKMPGPALVDASGDTIPFSAISWTSNGNSPSGNDGAEPFPAGTFANGGTQTVGAMASNTWNESCWTFSYSNASIPPAGTYTGVVTYTMTAP
jgi:hypothetical protein